MHELESQYHNILDITYNLDEFSKFDLDQNNFSFNYYFLNFLLWYLEYDQELESYVNKIPFKEHNNLERIYNAVLFYLEFFFHYENIIQATKFDYKFYPYSSFKEWDIEELEDRLENQIHSWFLSINDSFQKFRIHEISDEVEVEKNFSSVDPLFNTSFKKLRPNIHRLNYDWMLDKSLIRTILGEDDKAVLRDYAPIFRILNHIQHSDLILNQKSFNVEFEHIEFDNKDYSSLNKFIRFFDVGNIHSQLQQLTSCFLKYGLIHDMKYKFHFHNIYIPSIFIVDGPTEAVKKYSKLIIDEYNVYTQGDLARKLYAFCNVIDDSNEIQGLNIDSLLRIIHRHEPFSLNSNNCKK
ncbi:hypothetical protein [Gracilimonas sediminicola]|uniref:hypothetical protein n=1 Tax=Gracilimonas sediminicola TaxID=2952158 RepID=UPI0038D485DF